MMPGMLVYQLHLRRLSGCDYTEHQMPENALYCDNQGAITTANQPTYMVSGRSKHIDVRFHVIRDAAANGLIRLEYVRTEDMTTDILTKALPRETFQRHVRELGMVIMKRLGISTCCIWCFVD